MADTNTGKIQAATQGKAQKTLKDYVKAYEGEIAKALPAVMTPERFTRIVTTALTVNPVLQQCDAASFIGAMLTAAQLGLEPNSPLGQAYIIPYAGRASFQLGYKGLIDLAYRSGEVEVIQAHVVYDNDDFECSFGLEPKLKHVPASGARGNPVKVYAMFRTKSGGYGYDVMSVEDVNKIAQQYSKTYSRSDSPWKTNWEGMAKKTVLKQVLKYAPLKSDFVKAVATDNTVREEILTDMTDAGAVLVYNEDGEVIEDNSEVQ